MRIKIAQLDPIVGGFSANVEKIKVAYQEALRSECRLLLTPELSLCGYPPLDLLHRPEIFERNEKALREILALTESSSRSTSVPCAIAVGLVTRNPSPRGREALNEVVVVEAGKIVHRQAKSLLPSYDVFDETRYFEPAKEMSVWNCDGLRVGFGICEDFWARDPLGAGGFVRSERVMYTREPAAELRALGVDLLVSISASPFESGKVSHRRKLHQEVAKEAGVPLIYINQTGGTDEILFDGGSFVVDAHGNLVGSMKFFEPGIGQVAVDANFGVTGQGRRVQVAWESPSAPDPTELEVLHLGLVSGIREYWTRTGFKKAILGLSGGIDSAVVAALAVEALGPEAVIGVAMPSQYSSSHSYEDAEEIAKYLGIPLEVRPIKFLFSTALREFSEGRNPLAAIAQENLQSRLRGLVLMTLSNHDGSLVLTTGNKSEIAMGYCTLYGDMCGALAPIGDLYKTEVYSLAAEINRRHQRGLSSIRIPERSLTKPPSAELRPNQTDQDSLPPYEELDAVLRIYLESEKSVAEIQKRFPEKAWIPDALKKLELNEFKRRQAAPILKVSRKAFGVGRRVPIAKRWET